MSNRESIIVNSAFIETTSDCNLKCKHCYNDSGLNKSHISYKTLARLIKSLSELNAQQISISGGEPFLHPNFSDIIGLLDEYPIRYQLITNGTLLLKKASLLQKYKNRLSIQISLDGLGEIHDTLRGKGVFLIIDNNINMLHNDKFVYFFKTTINQYNYMHLEEIIDYAIKSGGHSISFSYLNPIGRGLVNSDLHLTDIQIVESHKKLQLLKNKYAGNIKIQVPDLFKNGTCPWFAYSEDKPLKISPRIDVDGNIYLCSAFMNTKFSIGNVNQSNMEDIFFRNNDIKELLSYIKLSKKYNIDCPTCILNSVCAKGCPASYLQKTNRYDDNFCNSRRIGFLQSICKQEGICSI